MRRLIAVLVFLTCAGPAVADSFSDNNFFIYDADDRDRIMQFQVLNVVDGLYPVVISDSGRVLFGHRAETISDDWVFNPDGTITFGATSTLVIPITISGATGHVVNLMEVNSSGLDSRIGPNGKWHSDSIFVANDAQSFETALWSLASAARYARFPDSSGTLALTEYTGATGSAENITGLWNFQDAGTGELFDYDVTVGDTTDYGIMKIGDALIGRTSQKPPGGGYNINGAFIIANRGGPVTGDIEFAVLDGSDLVRFALAKSGAGNATYNPRSMIVAGPATEDSDIVTLSHWQGEGFFDNLSMDTDDGGADLGIQNNLEVEAIIYADSLLESTSEAGVTIEQTRLEDGQIVLKEIGSPGEAAASGSHGLYADSDVNALVHVDEGGSQLTLGGLLYVETSDVTVSNTTTESDLITTPPEITNDRMAVGTHIDIVLKGEMRRSGGGTVEFVVELDGTEVCSTQPQFVGGSAHHFSMFVRLTIRSTGSSANIQSEGFCNTYTGSTTEGNVDFDDSGSTFNANNDLTISPRVQFSVADALNFITITEATITVY